MKSYTKGRALYGSLTRNTIATNLTLGDEIANDEYRHILSKRDWPFLQRLRTLSTVADTQAVNVPYDCDLVIEISVIPSGGTTRYTPRLSPSPEHWDHLNLTSYTSDIPVWYIVQAGQIKLWPTPSSSGNTIYVIQKTRVIDLSIADLTTPTVTAIANGATAMEVSAGLTAQMVGRWIRVTHSDTANTGDGLWYEIAGITDSTNLTLTRAYGGNTIAAGTAECTIGQMPLLPEPFHDTPWYRASATYWQTNVGEGSTLRSKNYMNKYDRDILDLDKNYSSPTTSMVIDDGRDDDEIINPNLTISL